MHRAFSTRTLTQKRSYFYSRYGELISQPRPIQSQMVEHPILGKYWSEHAIPQQNQDLLSKPLLDTHPIRELMKKDDVTKGNKLIHYLRRYQQEQLQNLKNKYDNCGDISKFQLGQLVYVRRRVCLTKPQAQSFVGVCIEVNDKGPQSTLRLRSLITGIGVELLVPLESPLIEKLQVIQEPAEPVQGPNLLGLRDRVEEMARFMPAELMNEKGRQSFIKRYEKQQQNK